MYLERLILFNWGNLPNRTYQFGSVNLFSGGSGSGKTTTADAIQTLMTAAHANLFQYNPGQNESTQRSSKGKKSRSLASYVLGCDDGSYARLDTTDSYIVGVFYPSEGEECSAFSSLIGIRAYLDNTGNQKSAREDKLTFMIFPEETLERSNLLQSTDLGEHVVSIGQLETHCIKQFGKGAFEKYDNKKSYLRRLYAAFRGLAISVEEIEAIAAAKAFSRFMAYKPVTDINAFVSEEVLEKQDLDGVITDISDQLRTIHQMESDATQLKNSIELLGKANDYAQNYIDNWLKLNTIDYMLAQYDYLQLQKEWLNANKELEAKDEELKKLNNEIDVTKVKRDTLQEQQVNLLAQRKGIPALQQKDELESNKEVLNKQLTEEYEELFKQKQFSQQNITASKMISDRLQTIDLTFVMPIDLKSLCEPLIQCKYNLEIKSFAEQKNVLNNSVLLKQAEEVQRLHAKWHHYWFDELLNDRIRRDLLAEQVYQKNERYNSLKKEIGVLKLQITRLENQKINYPPYVTNALLAIQSQCPQAEPKILCDYVDISDSASEWQAGIEGYLGGNRFAIIVDEAYEAIAIKIVKKIPGRSNVLQGKLAQRDIDKRNWDLDERSIVHVMEFNHEVARNYITASYGNVLRVDNAEELSHERRALTKDGMNAGSYKMWGDPMPDAQLVFGKKARLRALKARRKEFEILEADFNNANDEMITITSLLKEVNTLQVPLVENSMRRMIEFQQQIESLEQELNHLELGDAVDLDVLLEEINTSINQASLDNDILLGKRGSIEEQQISLRGKRSKLSDKKDETQEAVYERAKIIEDIAKIWTELNVESHLSNADLEAKSLNKTSAENERLEVDRDKNNSELQLDRKIQEHNQSCNRQDAVIYIGRESGEYNQKLFNVVCDTQTDIQNVRNRLKNNVYYKHAKELEKIRHTFDNTFVTSFCHSIHTALSHGNQQINQLNKELQNHSFGADKEKFRFDAQWISEFKEYNTFFKEVSSSLQLGEASVLFGEDSFLSETSQKVRDKIKEMLLDKDGSKAQHGLKRISDYRNYRRYEIYKEVEGKEAIPLSQYGTGSGGQLETPAYIVRSASITSAFRFSEVGSHLKMVLVDEAFSFMDEERSREIIDYLTNSLGLQLTFIMPSNKCGPFMNVVNNHFNFVKTDSTSKRGELNTQVMADFKILKKERVKELWKKQEAITYQQGEMSFMKEVLGTE